MLLMTFSGKLLGFDVGLTGSNYGKTINTFLNGLNSIIIRLQALHLTE